MVDVDGDGTAELVHYVYNNPDCRACTTQGVYVLRAVNDNGASWHADRSYTTLASVSPGVKLVDLNRDGLPDLVGVDSGLGYKLNYLNTGNPSKGDNGTVWKSTTFRDDSPTNPTRTADVDGDGLYDRITQAPGDYASVSLSTGLNWTTVWTDFYNLTLHNYTVPLPTGSGVPYGEFGSFAPGQFHVVDLNADGLVDIVVNHLGAGRPLINTGLSWFDSNFSNWRMRMQIMGWASMQSR